MNKPSRVVNFVIAMICGSQVGAGELGHYAPGLLNVRDLLVPDPGVYYAQYNFWYSTDTLRNRNGDKVDSLTVTGPLGGTVTSDIDVDVDVFALAPTFMWVTPYKVLGAKYAAFATPTFADNSAQVALGLARAGRFRDQSFRADLDSDTSFGVGDIFVQPLWLGWGGKHYDLAAAYGFYAPTGEEGISLEFWTHQFQASAAWYPFDHRGTAVTVGGTFETHSNMDGKDLTPGDRVSLNWGLSQYLPLRKDNLLLAELGVSGYGQWQVEKDSGADVPLIRNTELNAKDEIYAAGLQAGLVYVPWKAALTVRYQWEFGAEARFEGTNLVLTLAKGF